MKVKGDDVIFSTGKKKYANQGIIGIASDGEVTGGYDNGFWHSGNSCRVLYDEDEDLSKEEKVELAEFMIKRWKRFLANADQKSPLTEKKS